MKKLMVCFGLIFLGYVISSSANATDTCPNATLSFEQGKSSLTDSSKSELKELVRHARMSGKISGVQIAAWSDNPVPREGQELTKVDRMLAEKRANSVKKYLRNSLNVRSITQYNMAERANWLARTFDTPDAALKSGIAKDTPLSKEEFRIIRNNGSESKVVVVVTLK